MAKKTFSYDGISCKIEESILGSAKFVELFTLALNKGNTEEEQSKNLVYTIDLINFVLGDEKDKVYKMIEKRDKVKYASMTSVMTFLLGIVKQSDVAKKSLPLSTQESIIQTN